jgi:hypothetical protein
MRMILLYQKKVTPKSAIIKEAARFKRTHLLLTL